MWYCCWCDTGYEDINDYLKCGASHVGQKRVRYYKFAAAGKPVRYPEMMIFEMEDGVLLNYKRTNSPIE